VGDVPPGGRGCGEGGSVSGLLPKGGWDAAVWGRFLPEGVGLAGFLINERGHSSFISKASGGAALKVYHRVEWGGRGGELWGPRAGWGKNYLRVKWTNSISVDSLVHRGDKWRK